MCAQEALRVCSVSVCVPVQYHIQGQTALLYCTVGEQILPHFIPSAVCFCFNPMFSQGKHEKRKGASRQLLFYIIKRGFGILFPLYCISEGSKGH